MAYHININGDVKKCSATVRACRYSQETHFEDAEYARAYSERELQKQYETFQTPLLSKRKTHQEFEELLKDFPPSALEPRRPKNPVAVQLAQDVARELKTMNNSGDHFLDQGRVNTYVSGDSLTVSFQNGQDENDRVILINVKTKEFIYRIGADGYPSEFEQRYTLPIMSEKLPSLNHELIADKILDSMENERGNWDTDPKAVEVAYLEFNHGEMNRDLRANRMEKETREILDEISSRDTIEEDITVYRGLYLNDEQVSSVKDGTYSDGGLLSTSASPRTALNFSGNRKNSVVLAFKLKKGQKCLKVGGPEKEVLLPRNFELKDYEYYILDSTVTQ